MKLLKSVKSTPEDNFEIQLSKEKLNQLKLYKKLERGMEKDSSKGYG